VSEEALELWKRASQSLRSAELLLASDPDAAASRAYYAAFYAVSAFFALEKKFFSKHSGVERAVHQDLVKSQLMPISFGADYSFLRKIRSTGDYGGTEHVSREAAEKAVTAASRTLKSISGAKPDFFHA